MRSFETSLSSFRALRVISMFIVTVLLMFTGELSAQCQLPTNYTFTPLPNGDVALEWSGGSTYQYPFAQWGPCGFGAGTGNYAYPISDSVCLIQLSPGATYSINLTLPCGSTILDTTLQYTTLCGQGDSYNQPLLIERQTSGGPYSYGNFTLMAVDLSSTCYSNQISILPGKDAVYLWEPMDTVNSISVITDAVVDSSCIYMLDSNFNFYAQSNYQIGTGGPGPANSAAILDLPIDYEMKYYFVLELASPDTSSVCSDTREAIFTYTSLPCTGIDSVYSSYQSCSKIQLQWSKGVGADTTFIEYGPSGFMPGNGTFLKSLDTQAIIGQLSDSSSYDFYVGAHCFNRTPQMQGPFTFSTLVDSGGADAQFNTILDTVTLTYFAFTFDGSASQADSLIWDFGDGSPTEVGTIVRHNYAINSSYEVSCVAVKGCSLDTMVYTLNVWPESIDETSIGRLLIYPNPANTTIEVRLSEGQEGTIQITDMHGRIVLSSNIESGSASQVVEVSMLANGVYTVQIGNTNSISTGQLIISR